MWVREVRGRFGGQGGSGDTVRMLYRGGRPGLTAGLTECGEAGEQEIGMTAGNVTMGAFVQPLEWISAEMCMPGRRRKPGFKDAVGYLCTPGVPHDPGSLLRRYKEISAEAKRIFIAPNQQDMLEKLFWPLRHARASYVLGNYLGTIALSGVVCEMLVLLVYEMWPVQVGHEQLSQPDEERLFGDSFEDLQQRRRVEVLYGLKLVSDSMKSDFDFVRKTRNRYLHRYSLTHEDVKNDAVHVYQRTASLMIEVLGYRHTTDAVIFRAELIELLHRKGLVSEVPPEGGTTGAPVDEAPTQARPAKKRKRGSKPGKPGKPGRL